ncbi:MAG TPA: hypothetical protein VNS09_19220 [Solirubrobacter sp.]|nr:hypothetical protein [Solirubrobacter sp.]
MLRFRGETVERVTTPPDTLMREVSGPLLELALRGAALNDARQAHGVEADELRAFREVATVVATSLHQALAAHAVRHRYSAKRWERAAADLRAAAVSDHAGNLPSALGSRASLELLLAHSSRRPRRAVPAHLARAIGLVEALASLASILEREDPRGGVR